MTNFGVDVLSVDSAIDIKYLKKTYNQNTICKDENNYSSKILNEFKEMRSRKEPIGRPRQIYTGENERSFIDIDKYYIINRYIFI